mmetsp:Transcript_4836/g.14854  ORF Transcript_4836/g.14854 Transcript_4836/m.14854 type:complete len:244 (+) Transcript_4836:196-927(+)
MRRTAFARAAADGKRARRTSPDRKCSASSWDRSTHSHTAIWLSGSDQTSAVAGAPPPPPPLLLLPAPPSPLTESRMACPVVTTSEISACGGLAQGTWLQKRPDARERTPRPVTASCRARWMRASAFEKRRSSPHSPNVRGWRRRRVRPRSTVVWLLRPSAAAVMPSATPTAGLTTSPTAPCATPLKKPPKPPLCAPCSGFWITPATPLSSPPETDSAVCSSPSPMLRGPSCCCTCADDALRSR